MSDRIRVVTEYVTPDGKHHSSHQFASEWLEHTDAVDAANEMLANGATVCAAFVRAGIDIHAHLSVDVIAMLQRMRSANRLSIEHWQCIEKPGYKLIQIEYDGRLWVHGDAGCWSGAYGSKVSQSDFIRYAINTESKFGLFKNEPEHAGASNASV
jgi:hypothetical protein